MDNWESIFYLHYKRLMSLIGKDLLKEKKNRIKLNVKWATDMNRQFIGKKKNINIRKVAYSCLQGKCK